MIPVHPLFPESIFQLVRSDGCVSWHDGGHFHWSEGVCCCVHWCGHVHSQAGSAVEQSEPPLWWQVSAQAGLEQLGEHGLRPLEGVGCGHSPKTGGETLQKKRSGVYTVSWVVYRFNYLSGSIHGQRIKSFLRHELTSYSNFFNKHLLQP